ncbi:MAG: DNA methylase [Lentisphaerae bacterium ADurb.Bin082]|nr:MAG: DNA methylase [Lentisphaerae bacterium ADurb.Bin082]
MATLIETDFPFAHLSRIAEQESWRKEVYRPVYYLHKWWARRLGSVFRGIILGAQLEDNDDFWSRFYGVNDFSDTVIFDPFMGSGVTVGEAIKLRCRAIGRDINPVAVTACRAAFAKYDRMAVRDTFAMLEQTVAPKILSLFETRLPSGEKATVLYYFLVKTIDCPHCQKEIELFKKRIFSSNAVPKKDPTARALCSSCGAIVHTRYDAVVARCDVCRHEFNPQEGNAVGATVHCPFCGDKFKLVEAMRSQHGPLRYRRYAKMVLTSGGEKQYEPINEFDNQLDADIVRQFNAIVGDLPIVAVQPGYNTNQMLKHNYRYWHELFSDRQIVCIRHLTDAIQNIKDDKIKHLFACLFSGTLEFNNLFTSFKGEGTGAVRHMFANHVLKPELMPIEANMWGTPKSSGAFSCLYQTRIERALGYKDMPTEVVIDSYPGAKSGGFNRALSVEIASDYGNFNKSSDTVYLSQGDSSCTDIPERSVDLVVTDPPFFDNVHYSQLADFFYYWLNQLLQLAPSSTTRSIAEVQDTDASQFTTKLTSVFAECRRVLKDDGLFIFTYHHARHDGWTAVHRAIRHSGFVCVQSFPVKAEMTVSMVLQQAKSPIHLDLVLICRKAQDVSAEKTDIDPIAQAVKQSAAQASALAAANIAVSLSDAKVILMGQLLCAAHKMRCLDEEEAFLKKRESDVDEYVENILAERGEVLYKAPAAEQLVLFEQMAKYLTNHRSQRTRTNRAADT